MLPPLLVGGIDDADESFINTYSVYLINETIGCGVIVVELAINDHV